MTFDELRDLYNINHLENLESIREHGLLCHYRAAKLPHRSVAMQVIQDRRQVKRIPTFDRKGRPVELPLHDFANLYFNPRNKMMYKIKNNHSELCVYRIRKDCLNLPTVVVADRNASSDYVRFGSGVSALRRVDAELVYARSWNHDDPIEKMRHGSIVCAEVLIHGCLPPDYIVGVYVSCGASAETVAIGWPGLPVSVEPDVFFNGGSPWLR